MPVTPIYSDQNVRSALRRLAKKDGTGPTKVQYDKRKRKSDPSAPLLLARYGTWNGALRFAGLGVNASDRPRSSSIQPEACVQAIRKASKLVKNERLSYAGYVSLARTGGNNLPSGPTVRNKLGRWSDAKKRAGVR